MQQKKEIYDLRVESFLRIQRSDEFKEFANREKYIESKQMELRPFCKYMWALHKKKTAEVRGEMTAGHIREPNKGYAKGFTNYLTYDPKFNKGMENEID